MKKKNLLRSLAAALVLTLMLVTIPAAPVMAFGTVTVKNIEGTEATNPYYGEAMGTIGDRVEIKGNGGLPGLQYDVYFSSQPAEIGDDINEDVTVYDYVASPIGHITQGWIVIETYFIPDELTDGPVPADDEDVHGGTYYVYVTQTPNTEILGVGTFYITDIAEISAPDPDDGTVGTEVEISGTGFAPGEAIIVEYDGDDITDDVADAEADGNGDFTLNFEIPTSEYGEHTITITGEDSLVVLEETFTVIPEILLDPVSGEGGINVTITGTGFDGNKDVIIYFEGVEVKTKRADNNGSFDTFFAIPELDAGIYTVLAEDENNDDISDDADFTISVPPLNSDISVTLLSGNVGDTITVSGTEFAPDDTVTVYFDGVSIGTALTNGNGIFSGSFNIPASAAGSHIIKAEDTDDHSDTATFTVEPEMNMTPLSGLMGDEIDVSGTGFGANTNINILYGNVVIPPVATITTGPEGSFTGSFIVPALPGGSTTLTVTDGTNSFPFTFTVGSSVSISPTSGKAGDGVGMAGFGFGAGKTISVLFNNAPVTLLVPVTTGSDGTFSNVQFHVPASPGGASIITISDGTISKTVNFTVEPSSVGIGQTTTAAKPGYVGMELNVSGDGYKADADVEVIYTSDPVVVGTGKVGANGSFSVDFTIPASEAGEHSITVNIGGVEVEEYTFFMESSAPSRPGLSVIYVGIEAEAPISFDWNEVTGDASLPVTYVLQIFTLTGTTEVEVIKKELADTEYTLTDAEVLKLVPLENNEYYYWHIQAVDSAGNVSSWSDTDAFTIASPGGGWPGWLTWLLVGFGAFFLFIFAIMLGRRIAYSSY